MLTMKRFFYQKKIGSYNSGEKVDNIQEVQQSERSLSNDHIRYTNSSSTRYITSDPIINMAQRVAERSISQWNRDLSSQQPYRGGPSFSVPFSPFIDFLAKKDLSPQEHSVSTTQTFDASRSQLNTRYERRSIEHVREREEVGEHGDFDQYQLDYNRLKEGFVQYCKAYLEAYNTNDIELMRILSPNNREGREDVGRRVQAVFLKEIKPLMSATYKEAYLKLSEGDFCAVYNAGRTLTYFFCKSGVEKVFRRNPEYFSDYVSESTPIETYVLDIMEKSPDDPEELKRNVIQVGLLYGYPIDDAIQYAENSGGWWEISELASTLMRAVEQREERLIDKTPSPDQSRFDDEEERKIEEKTRSTDFESLKKEQEMLEDYMDNYSRMSYIPGTEFHSIIDKYGNDFFDVLKKYTDLSEAQMKNAATCRYIKGPCFGHNSYNPTSEYNKAYANKIHKAYNIINALFVEFGIKKMLNLDV